MKQKSREELLTIYCLLNLYKDFIGSDREKQKFMNTIGILREEYDPETIKENKQWKKRINKRSVQQFCYDITREINSFMSDWYLERIPCLKDIDTAILKGKATRDNAYASIRENAIAKANNLIKKKLGKKFVVDELQQNTIFISQTDTIVYGRIKINYPLFYEDIPTISMGDATLWSGTPKDKRDAIVNRMEAVVKLYRDPDALKEIQQIVYDFEQAMDNAKHTYEETEEILYNEALETLTNLATEFYNNLFKAWSKEV